MKGKDTLFEVVVGTYEKILYGLKVSEVKNSKFSLSVEPTFIIPAHLNSIKTINCGGRYLASGSADENIIVYDLKKRVDLGTLMHHQGSITSLQFVGQKNLLSASDDSSIVIWKSKDWELLKVLRGHKGRINDTSVHPNGQLALSVGEDKSLFVWNLMTGKKASSINLRKEGLSVFWDPNGTKYAVLFDTSIQIYSIGLPDPQHTIAAKGTRYTSAEFIQHGDDTYLIAGCNNSTFHIYGPINDKFKQEKHYIVKGHKTRVKAIKYIAKDEKNPYLITASSDGLVVIWKWDDLLKSLKSEKSTNYDISEEISSLAVVYKHKKKSAPEVKLEKENEEEEEDIKKEDPIDLPVAGIWFGKVRVTCMDINPAEYK
ncbi:WD40 repeat-like protein [Conidiobolus coronatus NRRL 28638]|uniref:WD40 repeat-like protein n=1 Tax=Conidiobolus coronatus (strain ATCC 28846 / CBS 209.66 / NRRL 28638) TaxID=796925 RepID=A0A137PBT5_CONC2|nr:WD40 repeat-like protein [Conidiobolus coronatus NRRL 28638]|eukprot:KXN72478.1 WD40 repeat-like protein [Conidiobolus coronatus NRRL 28638]